MSSDDVAFTVESVPTSSGDGDHLGFVEHMMAGAVAGIVEHVAMFPIDTIKTRMQALAHPGQRAASAANFSGIRAIHQHAYLDVTQNQLHRSSVWRALRAAVHLEGVSGLYRGVLAVAGGAGPAHALHFAVYEHMKEMLGGNRPGHHLLVTATSGAIATMVNDAVMTPGDVIKQRLQVTHSPYRGVMDCVRSILAQEGVGALFKSYRTTIVMNIPFTAMHFSVYESAKKLLGSEDDETLQVQLLAGGLAGGAAAAITNPLDVVKTRLQTEGVHSAKRYNTTAVLPTIRRIVDEEGMSALWRGVRPRVYFHIPAAAICWGTYESMKQLLGGLRPPQHPQQ